MTARLTVIYWRDIPAQVIAKAGRDSHRIELSPRFQQAIDRAAMQAGLFGTDDYLQQWRRVIEPCDGDLAGVATAAAARLERAYPLEVLNVLVENNGLQVEG